VSGHGGGGGLDRASAGLPAAPVRIVHLGLGAFHRAHQAWYTHAVDDDHEWGIAAFTGRSPRAAEELAAQDGLFTLIERGPEGDSATVVGSIVEAVDGADVARLVELVAAPGTAIVTLTITEAGYRLAADGGPDLDDPAVRSDLAALRSGGAPTTALGRLLLGLTARRDAGSGPLAVVSCDNLSGNGPLVRRGLLLLAERLDPSLADWIDRTVSFVSTSVDRITPAATAADRESAAELTGISDAASVVTEPFRDWVLCGGFPAGRPAWERAGARFVDDIEPFERRKLRLLNGAHTLLAATGRRRGLATVAEAIADPACRSAVEAFWAEAAAGLPAGLDTDAYCAALLERFGNPRIEHRLEQIGADATAKLRIRIVPVLLAERAGGHGGAASLRAVADWIALLLQGDRLPDAQRPALDRALGSARPVEALLRLVDPRLADDPALVAAVAAQAA
jgi:fructuronate reductase